jgi:hypothetical protein
MSKHWNARRWRHRVFVAATLAAGSLLLAAPAFAAKWTW